MSSGYIYLLRPLRSITDDKNIYKIGKTKRNNFIRFNEYPIGSILLLQSSCKNCDLMEKKILKIFDEQFIKENDYGREYFRGDLIEMKKLINSEIVNEENIVNDNNIIEELNESYKSDDEIINIIKNFECKNCKYTTNVKSNYKKHCMTTRHKNVINDCGKVKERIKIYSCITCNKGFKSRNGLWCHAKNCTIEPSLDLVSEENQVNSQLKDSGVVTELIKYNKELQNILIQQSKLMNKIMER